MMLVCGGEGEGFTNNEGNYEEVGWGLGDAAYGLATTDNG